jgi:D-tyrosyl-tRNA(Tyr) deacylase
MRYSKQEQQQEGATMHSKAESNSSKDILTTHSSGSIAAKSRA